MKEQWFALYWQLWYVCAFMFIVDDTLDNENEEFNMRRNKQYDWKRGKFILEDA